MKVVITGATSFIGVHVIEECIKKNYDLYAVIRKNSFNINRLPQSKKITVIEQGMDEYKQLSKLVKRADCFIHLAWEGARAPYRDNADLQQRNYEASIAAIRAAAKMGCKVFLGAGSQAEYGKMKGDVTEDYPCNPTTEYGRMKLKTCRELNNLSKKLNMRFIWTRIFSIYGKYDYSGTLIMSVLKKMQNNEAIELTACTQIWDYLHVEDAAIAIMNLVENDKAAGIFNIASGEKRPLRNFIKEMKEILNSDSELKFGVVAYGVGGAVDLRPDNRKLLSLGWRPTISFDKGISSLMQMSNYSVNKKGGQ